MARSDGATLEPVREVTAVSAKAAWEAAGKFNYLVVKGEGEAEGRLMLTYLKPKPHRMKAKQG